MCDTGSVLIFCLYEYVQAVEIAFFTNPPENRAPFTSATQCIHHPSFQKLFAKQIVAETSLLTIKRVSSLQMLSEVPPCTKNLAMGWRSLLSRNISESASRTLEGMVRNI
jgi:hypothetical protein